MSVATPERSRDSLRQPWVVAACVVLATAAALVALQGFGSKRTPLHGPGVHWVSPPSDDSGMPTDRAMVPSAGSSTAQAGSGTGTGGGANGEQAGYVSSQPAGTGYGANSTPTPTGASQGYAPQPSSGPSGAPGQPPPQAQSGGPWIQVESVSVQASPCQYDASNGTSSCNLEITAYTNSSAGTMQWWVEAKAATGCSMTTASSGVQSTDLRGGISPVSFGYTLVFPGSVDGPGPVSSPSSATVFATAAGNAYPVSNSTPFAGQGSCAP